MNETRNLLAALLGGKAIPWTAFGLSTAAFLSACGEERVTGLVYERARALPPECEWPPETHAALAAEARAGAAAELLQQAELRAVLDALAAEGIRPLILKGTALAYSVYQSPWSRPRVDTDLLIARDEVEPLRRIMAAMGYTPPLHCDGELLFCQFPLAKTGRFGAVHRFDCHWKISTQSVFADVLTYEDVRTRAVPIPPLGPDAMTLAPIDALLLACIHPVMHHRNTDSLLWIHDIHLLASCLSERDFERFAERTIAKKVSAICADRLQLAASTMGTRCPDSALRQMLASRVHERSAVYLRPNRRWIDELGSSIRGLPDWQDRFRLLREVVLPKPAYMLRAYGVERSALGPPLLPFLYAHRLLLGGWRVLARQK